MIVRLAGKLDTPGFLDLAGQVEHWFGPMMDDLGFHAAAGRHVRRAKALFAVTAEQICPVACCSAGSPRYIGCACGIGVDTRVRRGPRSHG